VYYCSSCGEVGDGRFCRMCGTALSPLADPAGTEQLSAVAATQVTTGPGVEFDGLFRSSDDNWGPTDQTRVLPAPGTLMGTGAGTDYQMAPPGLGSLPSYAPTTTIAQQQQPLRMPADDYPPPPNGYDEGWGPDDGEPEGPRKGVIYGTLGAVAVAIAVIGALLYLGTPSAGTGSNAAGSQFSTPAGSGALSTQGALVLPSANPTTPPPATTAPAQPTATAPASTAPPIGNSALPLGPGSTGALVTYVQERLNQLQYYNGPANGKFDQATAVAVQRFQAAVQEQGDPAGIVGRSTMTALIAAGSQPDLKLIGNDNSGDVKRLQEALDYAENAGLQANGNFTMSTRTAVMRYQSAVGLVPTGQVDNQTWAKLQSGALAS